MSSPECDIDISRASQKDRMLNTNKIKIVVPLGQPMRRIAQVSRIPSSVTELGSIAMIPLHHRSISAKRHVQHLPRDSGDFSRGIMPLRILLERNGSEKRRLQQQLMKPMSNGQLFIMRGYWCGLRFTRLGICII